jgi:hypothetical protein
MLGEQQLLFGVDVNSNIEQPGSGVKEPLHRAALCRRS